MSLHAWKDGPRLIAYVDPDPKANEHLEVEGIWTAPWHLADDYHVYGVDWEKDEIKFYVDGVVVRNVENTRWHYPLRLIFDSETMPDWFGMPKDEDLPSTFSVGYVRAWKKGEVAAPTRTKTSFKGWELYIWKEKGDTYFSLMVGTNRLKTDEEISKASVKGLDAIKPKLAELNAGEEVFVVGKKLMEPPLMDQATPVIEYGKKIGLKVQGQSQ
ncbi:MAG: family 16 glycosylhydrolase [Planctomycetota bacterium]